MRVSFYQWAVDISQVTPVAHDASETRLDPACCSACATYLHALRVGRVPAPVRELLRAVGVNEEAPLEIWGAPEGGFVSGIYEFSGRIHAGPTFFAGAGDAVAVVEPGWECWLAVSKEQSSVAGDDAGTRLQFEFSWHSDDLIELAAVVAPASV